MAPQAKILRIQYSFPFGNRVLGGGNRLFFPPAALPWHHVSSITSHFIQFSPHGFDATEASERWTAFNDNYEPRCSKRSPSEWKKLRIFFTSLEEIFWLSLEEPRQIMRSQVRDLTLWGRADRDYYRYQYQEGDLTSDAMVVPQTLSNGTVKRKRKLT